MENRFEHFTLDIFNISKYWNKIASEEMKEYGLRGAHALYLLILDGYEGEMTAARLADLCQRDKADVSRAIADFQKKGILEPYDGPRYRFTPKLTPRGHALAAQIRARATVALDVAGQGITDEMRENMYHCLDLIATNMRLICEDGLKEQAEQGDAFFRRISPCKSFIIDESKTALSASQATRATKPR